MKNIFNAGLAVMVACFLVGAFACRQEPQSRRYEENGAAAVPAPEKPQARPPAGSWRWENPRSWSAEASAGLRLATFLIPGPEGPGQCAIIPLPGDGGGVQRNVQRWLEQLRLPLFSPPELADFLGRQKIIQTAEGLPVTVIDFTTLSHPREPAGPSMLVAVVPSGDQTLFVKMSGGKDLLDKNREIFYKFCQSLSRGT